MLELLPYETGAAKRIQLNQQMGLSDDANLEKQDVAPPADDGRLLVVFVGEGGVQNGLHVYTYIFNGHIPANPEHERGRKNKKASDTGARDPIKKFEHKYLGSGAFSEDDLKAAKKEILTEVKEEVKATVKLLNESPMPPMD